MKKFIGILLLLCVVCTILVQPVCAAYGYESSDDLKGECGVTFDSNGGSGYMEPLWRNGSFKLPECEFTAPEGYRFQGWRWNGELKQPGDAVYLGSVIEAVAVWEKIPEVTVTFAPAGGTGIMDSISVAEGGEYALPQCTYTEPDGMMFDHWEVGGNVKYVGDTVTVTEDLTITAVWVALPVDHICEMQKIEKINPTDTESGKEEYFLCTGCGTAYEDSDGNKAIADLENWGVIAPLGNHASGAASNMGEGEKLPQPEKGSGEKGGNMWLYVGIGVAIVAIGLGVLIVGMVVAIVVILKKKKA